MCVYVAIHDVCLPGLENCPLLQTLDLSHNNLTHISNLHLLPNLTSLNLARNHLKIIENLAGNCENLENLNLSKNNIKRGFEELKDFKKLG